MRHNIWLFLAIVMFAPAITCAHVRSSLVAADASVQPGKPITVALRLDHEPKWHTYWINAGTGYATSIKWELPAGWSAGDIQWPVPTLIKNSAGAVTGHGYTGVLYLPVTVRAPKDATAGEKVILKAAVAWLMCGEVCIPGKADLSLSLLVSQGAAQPDSAVRTELARMVMPEPLPGDWRLDAVRAASTVTLTLAGRGGLGSPHFFSEDGYIQHDLAQKLAVDSGRLIFTLPISEDAIAAPQTLLGVLAYTDATGAYHGVRVDQPLRPAPKNSP